jgi:hypothetical protein
MRPRNRVGGTWGQNDCSSSCMPSALRVWDFQFILNPGCVYSKWQAPLRKRRAAAAAEEEEKEEAEEEEEEEEEEAVEAVAAKAARLAAQPRRHSGVCDEASSVCDPEPRRRLSNQKVAVANARAFPDRRKSLKRSRS